MHKVLFYTKLKSYFDVENGLVTFAMFNVFVDCQIRFNIQFYLLSQRRNCKIALGLAHPVYLLNKVFVRWQRRRKESKGGHQASKAG